MIVENPSCFFKPTDANLNRIGQDLEANLYGSYHFNFISPISRQKMEDLASKAIKANVVSQVSFLLKFCAILHKTP